MELFHSLGPQSKCLERILSRKPSKSLKRSNAKRKPKPKITFICEGKNSEPHYFQALRRHLEWTLVDIVTVPGVGVPSTIHKRAVAEKKKNNTGDSFTDRDQYWAIFDRDEHPCYYTAQASCKKDDIELGISNPCFEVWLILHLQDYDKPDGRHEVQKLFNELTGVTDSKAKSFAYDDIAKNFADAVSRSERQYRRREEEKDKNLSPPYTTLHKLKSISDIS